MTAPFTVMRPTPVAVFSEPRARRPLADAAGWETRGTHRLVVTARPDRPDQPEAQRRDQPRQRRRDRVPLDSNRAKRGRCGGPLHLPASRKLGVARPRVGDDAGPLGGDASVVARPTSVATVSESRARRPLADAAGWRSRRARPSDDQPFRCVSRNRANRWKSLPGMMCRTSVTSVLGSTSSSNGTYFSWNCPETETMTPFSFSSISAR